VKTTKRDNKSGVVRYLHLAHNEWDPVKGRAVPKVLFTFGREDDLDRDAVKRLVASLSRLLDPADALAAGAAGTELAFVCSRPFGGAYALDHLWRWLGIDDIVTGLGQPKRGRHHDVSGIERVLFALVANRALAPSSKLAAADWIRHDVHIDRLPETSDDACYRAMDWLHQVKTNSNTRCSIGSRPCWTSRLICCSSTPPPPISRSKMPTSRSPATRRVARQSIPNPARTRWDSGPGGSRRIHEMTCRRS